MRKGRLIILGLFLMAVTVFPELAGAEVYFGFYPGFNYTYPSNLTVSQPALGNYLEMDNVRWDSRSFEGPIYYGFRVGYFFEKRPHWGVEFDFTHPKATARTEDNVKVNGIWHGLPVNGTYKMNNFVSLFEISHGYNFALINLVYRHGFMESETAPLGRVQFTMRCGVGPTLLHPESTVDGRRHYIESGGYEAGEWGLQAAPGLEIQLWKNLGLTMEYKYTYLQIDNVTIQNGWADTVFKTDHYTLGVVYHMNKK